MITTKRNAAEMVKELRKEGYKDVEGLFGYAICEAAADPFNGYQIIGKRVLELLEMDTKYEAMIYAITGKTMDYLKKKMREDAEYYDSLDVDN